MTKQLAEIPRHTIDGAVSGNAEGESPVSRADGCQTVVKQLLTKLQYK